jgi:hypothetical protein
MKNQEEKILAYLQKGNKLTPIQALKKFDCWALSSRIANLRKEGHPIETEIIRTPTDKYVARYYYDTLK